MSEDIDWEVIVLTIGDYIQTLCQEHVVYEESLGGYELVSDPFLKGRLYGQQEVLLAIAGVVSSLVPQPDGSDPRFYEPPVSNFS